VIQPAMDTFPAVVMSLAMGIQPVRVIPRALVMPVTAIQPVMGTCLVPVTLPALETRPAPHVIPRVMLAIRPAPVTQPVMGTCLVPVTAPALEIPPVPVTRHAMDMRPAQPVTLRAMGMCPVHATLHVLETRPARATQHATRRLHALATQRVMGMPHAPAMLRVIHMQAVGHVTQCSMERTH
jgi:hypothetical protein